MAMRFENVSPPSPPTTSQHPNLRLPATCDPPSEHNPPKRASWIVFGATGHMGRSLVRAILSHGDQCTAVGWTQENTLAHMQKWQRDGNCLGLLCDVRVRETVDTVIRRSIDHWGNVDIIANCTGYGVISACEDQDDHDLRNQFTTNFLGTLHIIQLSLPHFRAQSHGRYLIFSSTAGALGVPGLGPYCATKYAVEGLIESMLYEIDIFGIKATLVEPGYVRLDDVEEDGDDDNYGNMTNSNANSVIPSSSSHVAANPPPPAASSPPTTTLPKPKRYSHFHIKPHPSAAYASSTSPSLHAKRMVQWFNDRQPVSAVKSAELVWQLGQCRYPPLRLLLGNYAVESIRDRLKCIIEEIEDWKHLAFPVTAEEEREAQEYDARKEREVQEMEDEEMGEGD